MQLLLSSRLGIGRAKVLNLGHLRRYYKTLSLSLYLTLVYIIVKLSSSSLTS